MSNGSDPPAPPLPPPPPPGAAIAAAAGAGACMPAGRCYACQWHCGELWACEHYSQAPSQKLFCKACFAVLKNPQAHGLERLRHPEAKVMRVGGLVSHQKHSSHTLLESCAEDVASIEFVALVANMRAKLCDENPPELHQLFDSYCSRGHSEYVTSCAVLQASRDVNPVSRASRAASGFADAQPSIVPRSLDDPNA